MSLKRWQKASPIFAIVAVNEIMISRYCCATSSHTDDGNMSTDIGAHIWQCACVVLAYLSFSAGMLWWQLCLRRRFCVYGGPVGKQTTQPDSSSGFNGLSSRWHPFVFGRYKTPLVNSFHEFLLILSLLLYTFQKQVLITACELHCADDIAAN